MATWRSETLNALSIDKDNAETREHFIWKTSINLFEILVEKFPIIDGRQDCFHRLLNQVVIPMANLALQMQLSTNIYEFLPFTSGNPFQYNGCLYTDNFKEHKIIDIKTRKILRSSTRVTCDKEGSVGRVLMLLEPGLVRVGQERSIELCQNVYLAELHRSLSEQTTQRP